MHPDSTTISIRATRSLKSAAADRARAEGLTISELLRELLRSHVVGAVPANDNGGPAKAAAVKTGESAPDAYAD